MVGTDRADTAVAITLAEHAEAPVPLCDSLTGWADAAFPDLVGQDTDGGRAWIDQERFVQVGCGDGLVELVVQPSDGVVD